METMMMTRNEALADLARQNLSTTLRLMRVGFQTPRDLLDAHEEHLEFEMRAIIL